MTISRFGGSVKDRTWTELGKSSGNLAKYPDFLQIIKFSEKPFDKEKEQFYTYNK